MRRVAISRLCMSQAWFAAYVSAYFLSPVRRTAVAWEKKWPDTYAANQARLLLHSREITTLLIDQTRAYHRGRMNQLRPDPLQYKVGDLVLAKRAVK